MSLEAALAENTAALKENTEAHLKLAGVAIAAGKARPQTDTKDEEKSDGADAKAAEAEAKKKAAAEKRAAAKAKKEAEAEAEKKAAAEPPELEGSVSAEDLVAAARAFLTGEDEDEREDKKKKVGAAFAHIGVKKVGEIESDEDRARVAGYIAYWSAGLAVDFEAVDEIVSDAGLGI